MRRYKLSLGLAVLLLVALGIVTLRSQLPVTIIPLKLQDTVTLSLGILYEALPFVFLGIFLSVLIQRYVKSSLLLKYSPKNGFLRRAYLSIFGVFLPVCECGNVPLARGLISKGLRPPDVMTFLLAAPIINPVTIFTTVQAFPGASTVVIRVLAAFFIANLIGWLFSTSKQTLTTPAFDAYCEDIPKRTNRRHTSVKNQLVNFSIDFRHEIESLLPSLIAGSLVAGLIQTMIPRSILISVSSEPVLAIVAMMVLAFVVSICANVDAFFALSLSSIFPMSAILAFLVFGPMVDIKMLALLKTTFTRQTLATMTLCVALCTLTLGLVVHYAI
jgi:uncharacterized membrane protein YraQ (UPF0718 family)